MNMGWHRATGKGKHPGHYKFEISLLVCAIVALAVGFTVNERNVTEISDQRSEQSLSASQSSPSSDSRMSALFIESDDEPLLVSADEVAQQDSASAAPASGLSLTQSLARLTPQQTLSQSCATDSQSGRLHCRTRQVAGNRVYGSAAKDDAPEGLAIKGRIMAASGAGIPDMTIVATPIRLDDIDADDSELLRFYAVSDSQGSYVIQGLPEGEYTVRNRARDTYRSQSLRARAGVDYADIVALEDMRAVIRGQVLSPIGEPLPAVTVLPIATGLPSVLTDDEGRFELRVRHAPTTHSMALRFQSAGYVEKISRVDLHSVKAAYGDDIAVELQPVESWSSLSGVVSSDSGDPLAALQVELRSADSQATYRAITDSNGRYEFPFVAVPADYQLQISGGRNHRDYRQPLYLTSEGSEFDIAIAEYDFGTITGQLVNRHGEPVPDFSLVLRNKHSSQPNNIVSTDAAGYFEVSEVPAGELIVASQSTPAILVQGLQLAPGGQLHIPIVLDWGSHELRGTVVDENGYPVAASRVVLEWAHESGGVKTRATRRTAADTQGQFAFSNLGPGPHTLQVAAPGYQSIDFEHDLSRQGYIVTVRMN